MSEVGLDEEEFQSIKKRLKVIGCIQIETHFPEYCNIGYKRVWWGMYGGAAGPDTFSKEVKEKFLKKQKAR